jgi:hypothetical protein
MQTSRMPCWYSLYWVHPLRVRCEARDRFSENKKIIGPSRLSVACKQSFTLPTGRDRGPQYPREIPSTVTGEPDSIPAIHADTHGRERGHVSYASDCLSEQTKRSYSLQLRNPSSRGPADGCADEGVINAMPPTTSLIHFFFAIFSISLTLFIFFFTVAWFTVLRETRLMKDQVLSDANGVSLHIY